MKQRIAGGGDLAEGNALAAIAACAVLHRRHVVFAFLGFGPLVQGVVAVDVMALSVPSGMVMVLADNKVLTAIRMMASKEAMAARRCCWRTLVMPALLTLGPPQGQAGC